MENNPKHNRRTNKCRDRVDGQVAFKRGQTRNEVAEQSQIHADEGRGGDEQFVVAALEQETRDVRHGQTQESNGTAKRRDERREEPRSQDDEHTAPPDVHAEVFSVTLAQQQEVQGLEQQERGDCTTHNGDGEERQLCFAYIGETAHAPNHKGVQAFLLAEEFQNICDRAGDVGNHDAHQHKADHASEP